MSTAFPESGGWVTAILADGTEYCGPPLDEACEECGAPIGVPCKGDEEN